ncbi:MAG: asparagine synthase (glutamine-hydrolyzing) [Bacteroidales bacterium]|nr:asparagine synthase (glutamine-hydrolyzing) [Bacteroidales bacterium]
MCGIAGVYGIKGDRGSRKALIRSMVSTIQHRGPDGWGYYLSPEVLLGQTRLSIVDLKGGVQPMTVGDYVIIFNGEIFNHVELKQEMIKLGVEFTTSSDTEVLLRAYIYFGTECFSKLNGQFAVLIWNKVNKELIVARDRFSIRPLYYTLFDGQYFFASEMKAFDKIPGYQRGFNISNLFEHGLLWNTTANKTVYKDIFSLPGGSFAVFKNGQIVKQQKYYELGQNRDFKFSSYSEAENAFKDLLDDAVKIQLRSDVPVGAYLSGGIDSSVILHLISKHNSKAYKTFSVAFEDKEYDESKYQKMMAQQINTEHFTTDITYDKVDANFPEAIYHTERPIFRTAPVPLYLLSKLVRTTDIKVVLTGEGADEILWGYDSFKEVKLLEFWSKFPESKLRPTLIRKLYPHLSNYNNQEQFGMMRMFYEGFLGEINNELSSANIRVHNNQILQSYFDSSHEIKYDKNSLLNEFKQNLPNDFNKWTVLQKSQYVEMKTLLSGYLLSSQGDRMSMANGVEGRYPFLDHRVIDMLFFMKESYKLNGFDQKYMLKKAFSKNIPREIIDRPKRPYMSPDLRSFIRGNKLTDNAAYFMSESMIKDYQIFNPKWVQRFLNKFNNGIPENLGYRDNMIITFILSTQIANYWAKNPKTFELNEDLLTIEIDDYKN